MIADKKFWIMSWCTIESDPGMALFWLHNAFFSAEDDFIWDMYLLMSVF